MEDNNPLKETLTNVENQIKNDFSKETEKFKKKNGPIGTIILYSSCVVLIIVCLILINSAIKVGKNAFDSGYTNKKNEIHNSIYDYFYNNAKQKYLVSNRAIIELGNIREESNLEVLKVVESTYVTQTQEEKDKGITRWVKYVGEGVFTIDLTESEFLVNDSKHYVLIRVPEPVMTTFGIQTNETEPLLYVYDKFAANGSYKEGADLSIDFQQRAEISIQESINNNQNYYSKARESAKDELTRLVRLLNPGEEMQDLVVEVEFID